jgi:hypothetical protein
MPGERESEAREVVVTLVSYGPAALVLFLYLANVISGWTALFGAGVFYLLGDAKVFWMPFDSQLSVRRRRRAALLSVGQLVVIPLIIWATNAIPETWYTGRGEFWRAHGLVFSASATALAVVMGVVTWVMLFGQRSSETATAD